MYEMKFAVQVVQGDIGRTREGESSRAGRVSHLLAIRDEPPLSRMPSFAPSR